MSPKRAAGVAGAATALALGALASKALGFVRDIVFAGVFGAGGEMDAFFLAQSVPNIAITLLSSAVATASIPVLAGLIHDGRPSEAARTFRSLINLTTVALALACTGLALAADHLVAVMAPGFETEQAALAATLTRTLLSASAFVAATTVISGFLQAHNNFVLPAIVGIPFNLAMIAAAILFGESHGVPAIAFGFVVGSALRVLVLLPGLRSIEFRYRPSIDLGDEQFCELLRLVPPLVAGYAIADVNGFVDRLVGSQQEVGTISALNYAYRLVRLPHALIVLALVQAIYPSLGGALATADQRRFGDLLIKGLQLLTLALAPIAVLMVILAEPLIEFAYGRGNFGQRDTVLTAAALAGYSFGLITLALRELVARGLFALRDTRTPTLIAVLGMVVNVVGDVVLGRALGAFGLALTTTLSFTLTFALTARALASRAELEWERWRAVVVSVVLAGVMLAAVSWLALEQIGAAFSASPRLVEGLAKLAIPALLGLGAYGLVLWLLRTPGLDSLMGAIAGLLRSIRSRLRASEPDR